MSDKWPSLPKTVYSPLGPFTVAIKEGSKEADCFGSVDYITRAIHVSPNMLPATQWHTLGHEIAHVIHHESGVDELMDEQHLEMVCTLFGQWFALAVLSGWLVVKR